MTRLSPYPPNEDNPHNCMGYVSSDELDWNQDVCSIPLELSEVDHDAEANRFENWKRGSKVIRHVSAKS